MGFANLLDFPLGTHAGIIVVRLRNELPSPLANVEVVRGLTKLTDEDLRGTLVILEAGRIRLRRQQPDP